MLRAAGSLQTLVGKKRVTLIQACCEPSLTAGLLQMQGGVDPLALDFGSKVCVCVLVSSGCEEAHLAAHRNEVAHLVSGYYHQVPDLVMRGQGLRLVADLAGSFHFEVSHCDSWLLEPSTWTIASFLASLRQRGSASALSFSPPPIHVEGLWNSVDGCIACWWYCLGCSSSACSAGLSSCGWSFVAPTSGIVNSESDSTFELRHKLLRR